LVEPARELLPLALVARDELGLFHGAGFRDWGLGIGDSERRIRGTPLPHPHVSTRSRAFRGQAADRASRFFESRIPNPESPIIAAPATSWRCPAGAPPRPARARR